MAGLFNLARGTRSGLNTLISGSKIAVGRLYHLTDENRVVLGTATGAATDLAKRSDDYFDITNTAPGLPTAGTARIYRRDVAGRGMLGVVGADGDYHTSMPHLGRNAPAWLTSLWGSASYSLDGFPAFTALGTPTARSWASTSRVTRAKRVGFASAATAASFAGIYNPTVLASVGDSSTGAGGFHFITRFAVSDPSLVTSCKMFIGLSNIVAAPTNVEINTLTNTIGIGKLSTSANLCVYCAGTTAQAVVDLGTSFPADTTNTDFYEFIMFSAGGSSAVVSWQLNRFSSSGVTTTTSGTFANGTPGTTGPTSAIGLAPRAWRMTPSATAIGLDIANLYLETDI